MIRFENVTYRYPDGGAGIHGISFEVGEGELVAVIGQSGSGKTTLLKLLAGFIVPDSGRILVGGEDVSRLPPHRRDLGIVFQSYALFRHMNAWQNVAYPLKVRGMGGGERRRRALDALAKVGLSDFADRLPATLSGGQQQRVALARALVFEPRALLLDEPLSALDVALRHSMRDEILRVQRDAGIATLHVTHDQEEALSIAHRVAVMRAGRIAQIATPRALYDAPVDRMVAAFVGQANLWPGQIEGAGVVRTGFGALACDTGGLTSGPVTVLVRPEQVRPERPDGRAPNTFAGALVHDRFLGAVRRYDLEIPGGVIRGETSIRDAIDAVSIPPEAIRLLPPEA
jgi:putative spermidine/putrescine transport system ATP-binding protein